MKLCVLNSLHWRRHERGKGTAYTHRGYTDFCGIAPGEKQRRLSGNGSLRGTEAALVVAIQMKRSIVRIYQGRPGVWFVDEKIGTEWIPYRYTRDWRQAVMISRLIVADRRRRARRLVLVQVIGGLE